VWADSLVVSTAITAPAITDLLSGLRSIAGASTLGATIIRTHVSQNAFVAAGTGTGTTNIRVGLIVAPATVEAVDVDPVAEAELDWSWNRRYHVGNTAITIPHDSSTMIDCKAKRKCEEIGDSYFIVATPELGGATSLTYGAHVRVLLALP